MSVLTQIEQALASCNQARFEKIVGVLLKARGIGGLTLLGTVTGKDKTKTGIPDIYATTNGDAFEFVACTTITGASAVTSKLIDDIDECASLEKTGIENATVHKIHLAFNSNLKPFDLKEIGDYAREKHLTVEFLPLSDIALDIQRRPWIAADELGIKIDSGQLLPIDAFVEQYDQGKLATPLDTQFRFRDQLLVDGLQSLETPGSSLLISGPAGMGKTRLALEIARRLAEHPIDLQVFCIYSKDLPLFDDLQRYFSAQGNYLVLVDDANRVNGRIHVLGLAKQADQRRTFRFIFTVRDYAEKEVVTDLKHLSIPHRRLSVGPLTRKEITEYIDKEFGITNDIYQSQIWALSQGNARLATMAAKEAVRTNNLSAISDVTELYELYFNDVTNALNKPGSLLLKALGILSVLRHIREHDEGVTCAIQNGFGISKSEFWSSIDQLHDLEFVDLHGHEVAKISDQVLATFCFYLCFIKHRALSFEALIKHFSKQSLRRIQDAVYGALNTMDAAAIRKVIDAPLIAAIKKAPHDQQLTLVQSFWFVDTALALHTVKETICAFPDATDSSELNWDDKESFSNDQVLSILGRFSHSGLDDASTAIELALLYLAKRPEHAGKVLKLLTEAGGFGIGRFSQRQRYVFQQLVVRKVIDGASRSDPYPELLIQVATNYLDTEFDDTFSEDRHTFTICRVGLENCPEILSLRKELWRALKHLSQNDTYHELLREFLLKYARNHSINDHRSEASILQEDARELGEWVEQFLSPTTLQDCLIIHALHRRFRHRDINAFEVLADRFCCPSFKLLQLIKDSYCEDVDPEKKDYAAYQQTKADRLYARYGATTPEELPVLVQLCQEIRETSSLHNEEHSLRLRFTQLFQEIGKRNGRQLAGLTDAYLALGDPLNFGGWSWTPSLTKTIGKTATRQLIESHTFSSQPLWLLELYSSVDESDIEAEDIDHVLSLIKAPDIGVPGLDTLRRFEKHEPKILHKVVHCVLETRGERAAPVLQRLLSHHSDCIDWISNQFADDVQLLITAYLTIQGKEQNNSHFDYDARLFDLLLNLNKDFIREYVAYQYADTKWLSPYNENHRDYKRLWARPDWPVQLVALVDTIISSAEYPASESYLEAWLPQTGARVNSILADSELAAVLYLIRARATNRIAMQLLFRTASGINADQRLAMVKEYLQLNPSFDDFKSLSFRSGTMSSSDGSFLSQYQGQATFLERVRELLTGMEFLEHRADLNEQIRSLQHRIANEEEREFLDDD